MLSARLVAALALLGARADSAPRPITHGQLDPSDMGVVGLVAGGRVTCTGTLVAPRVVITAAHCLLSSTVTAVLVGADLDSGRQVPAVHALVHPSFDATSLRDDVGVVLVAEPLTATPWPLLATPLDASSVGAELRLVGFGQTSSSDAGAARKREGRATLAALTDADLELRAAPSLTCGGDSGGPAFLAVGGAETLAGITSSGDPDCTRYTRSVRADRHLAFVSGFVARTATGAAAPGERCFYPAHCATGRCRFPTDAPSVGYCAAACRADAECAGGMRCEARECRYPEPSPGALGTPCASYTGCDSLLCASGVCSVVCDVAARSCPDGYECQPDAEQPALEACFRASVEGGCRVAPTGTRADPLLLLIVPWLWLMARRTRGCP